MKQVTFEWAEKKAEEVSEVAFDRETTTEILVLMARALVAVVRAAEEEVDDER